ncbi:dihydrofolate reductase-like domain-containing protein [Irpex rosettiformis]|uniref:Dihydrofolate reductase-like domain-containing protein n=1 Tax=Irpex rosettiformis TaxID=378272 RepID=A0ACB8UKI3_9APHY|nr:dihydrofolate reductase-like domain-containing protein [Irpex rosettiformis]
MTRLTLIVAATVQNGIGQSGRLPWRLPQEMAYFARVTTNAPEGRENAVIMGRNTWESIPAKFKPLQKRLNVVVSRNNSYDLATTSTHAHLSLDLPASLEKISQADSALHRIFVIGGASLYTESLLLPTSDPAFVDRILLTRILSPAFEDCDVFMPDFLRGNLGREVVMAWKRASHNELQEWVGFEVPEGVQEEKGIKYEFQMWTR